MRRCLLSLLVVLVASSRIEAACVEPSTFVPSTMSIARSFNEDESRVLPGVAGIRGTGWFLSPRLMVTAAHVADAMEIPAQEWKDMEVRNGTSKRSVPVRLLHRAGSHSEKIA